MRATEREVQQLREIIEQKMRKKGYVDHALDWMRHLWQRQSDKP